MQLTCKQLTVKCEIFLLSPFRPFLSLLQFHICADFGNFLLTLLLLVSWCDVLKNRIIRSVIVASLLPVEKKFKEVWFWTHLRLRPPPLTQRSRLCQDCKRRIMRNVLTQNYFLIQETHFVKCLTVTVRFCWSGFAKNNMIQHFLSYSQRKIVLA